MSVEFIYDARLGISVPQFDTEWENLHVKIQATVLMQWEEIRGDIPDRIKELEKKINKLQNELYEEEEFNKSCEINSSIAELASIINDLWIWYRTGDYVEIKESSLEAKS